MAELPQHIVFWMKFCSTLILLNLLVSSGSCENCSLPAGLTGHWFIKEFANVPPFIINSTTNSISRSANPDDGIELGSCVWRKKDLYMFMQTNRNMKCHKCILISEKHKNVLYSKEGDFKCQLEWDEEEFEILCDELLQSEYGYFWFRKDYKPINCPFGDSTFQFSYSKGGGEKCETPVSHSSSCIDSTKIELQYEACHDNKNSVGIVEQLTCVGKWYDSGHDYFVADVTQLNNRGHRSLQERLRCFIYKANTVPNPVLAKPPIVTGYDVGTSDTATCTGLDDPDYAETIIYLKRENPTDSGEKPCSFPKWLARHNWRDMGMSVEFELDPLTKNRSIHVRPTIQHNFPDAPNLEPHHGKQKSSFFPLSHSSLVCLEKENVSQSKDDDSEVAVIAKYTVGCKIDEICVHIIQRSENIAQIYYLERSAMSRDTYREKCFNSTFMELSRGVTMISTKGSRKSCPFPGKYLTSRESGSFVSVINQTEKDDGWSIGCDGAVEMHTHSTPNDALSDNFSCTDGWKEENSTYTILSSTSAKDGLGKLYCMKSRTASTHVPSVSQDVLITSQDCIHISEKPQNDQIEFDGPLNPIKFNIWLYRAAYCNSTSVDESDYPTISTSRVDLHQGSESSNSSSSHSSMKRNSSAYHVAITLLIYLVASEISETLIK